ncbi:hypothetical protein NEF87_001068 [Candidatus Lokiarchaeum ossiferum]|uniref:HTH arsR-type domain-containing protein n=1 Tax=Candidatus Lokiarchaeum ossiferum TaxID=2951803 RepID=A0ABY6HMP7_9ARCH|nr:hypothetical protein NEF87_001068 [Candidatus Lokiarchaeum sp. B-35]
MDSCDALGEMQKRLFDGEEFIIPLSKAISHPFRYKIMIFLYSKARSFQYLEQKLIIGRTALSNHLKHLLDAKLIRKPERGHYISTENGKLFLKIFLDYYNKIKVKELNKAREIQQLYKPKYQKAGEFFSFHVSNPAIYHQSWLSFLGAFLGVLKSHNGKWELYELGGMTGYFFITNVANNLLCPSGPTALSKYIWESMNKQVESLGIHIQHYLDLVSYPSNEQLSPKDHLRALKFKNWVIDQLKTTKNPIIAWGIPIPEFGIINGIQNNQYICSTFRHLINMEDDPVFFEHLQAPGGLWGYSLEIQEHFGQEKYKEEWDLSSLKLGLKFNTETPATEGYTNGIQAYSEWAQNLESLSHTESDYHGNSYVGACLCEQKAGLSKYLQSMSDRYSGKPQAEYLHLAAKEYQQVADILQKFTQIFPFSLRGSFSNSDRKKGSGLLRSIPPFEEEALKYLRNAIKFWNLE